MTVTVLKHAAGIAAGALVAFSAGFSCAETLKPNLGIWPQVTEKTVETAQLVVAPPPVAQPKPVTRVQAKTLPSAVTPPAQAPTGAEIANKLLTQRASDPDVPLPLPNLAERSQAEAPLDGPRLFGRSEPGGGVLGFRMPIRADRSGSNASAR